MNPSNGNRSVVEGVGWRGVGGGSVVTFGAPVEGNRSPKAVVAGARRRAGEGGVLEEEERARERDVKQEEDTDEERRTTCC